MNFEFVRQNITSLLLLLSYEHFIIILKSEDYLDAE
jgi:hypothetical protein